MDQFGWSFWISPGSIQYPQPSGDPCLGAIVEDLEPLLTSGKSGHYHLGLGFQIGWEISYTKKRKKKGRKSFSLRPKVYLELCPGAILFSPLWSLLGHPVDIRKELRRQSQWQGSISPWEQGLCRRSNLGPDSGSLFLSCVTLALLFNLSGLSFFICNVEAITASVNC